MFSIRNDSNYQTGDGYKVTFMKLGRLVEKGSGIDFAPKDYFKPMIPPLSGPQSYTKRYLHYQYAHHFLAKAYFFAEKDDLNGAKLSWQKAASIVPYAYPALENLCQVSPDPELCNKEHMEEMKKLSTGFY